MPIEGISVPSIHNLIVPNVEVVIISLIAGFAFFAALLSLYAAFVDSDASDVVPVAGSASAICALILSGAFFGEVLTTHILWGFLLLVFGTFLVSRLRLSAESMSLALLSGFFFGLHFVVMKELFILTNFDTGFLWSRLGIVIAALVTLILPMNRNKFHEETRQTGARGGLWIVGNKTIAGLSSIIILKAVDLGSVAIVQALGGLQFVFILIFAFMFGNKTPHEAGENTTAEGSFHKVLAIVIIIIGFTLLFL